jgi:hypothetical protein
MIEDNSASRPIKDSTTQASRTKWGSLPMRTTGDWTIIDLSKNNPRLPNHKENKP